MTTEHQQLIRSLIAAQVAVLEHADEDISVTGASDALIQALNQAMKLAKKLKRDEQ